MQRHTGKTWELKPKVVYWIYTAVVRPIITYAATIWWPRIKLKTSQAELSKLQLLGNYMSNENSSNSCNGSSPWTPPLHLQVEAEAKMGNYRLQWYFGIRPLWNKSNLVYVLFGREKFCLVYDLCLEYDSRARTCIVKMSPDTAHYSPPQHHISKHSTLLSKVKWGYIFTW
jgi:hypothetical protein